MTLRKINLLGGTGFIGSHLIQELVKLHGVNSSILSHRRKVDLNLPKTCKVIRGSLLDKESLDNFIEPRSTVINLSNIGAESFGDNMAGALNLARVCTAKKVKRIIHCSTAVVAGRTTSSVVNEETKCIPSTAYEKNKLQIENLLLDRIKNNTEIVIVRPTAVFGRNGKNLLKLAKEVRLKSRAILLLKTSLNYKRRLNLISVENVAAAFLFFVKSKDSYYRQRFIVSDDNVEENNYFDVVNLLCKYFRKRPVRAMFIPFRYAILRAGLIALRRSNICSDRVYSADKLFNSGFRPPVQFQDGIKKFADWYIKTLGNMGY